LSAASADAEIRVICGPTAAGKSGIAMWLADHERTAIISADSRQIYRGFDVGTAKPTPSDRARIPHFGIDVAAPTERFSAAAWADSAGQWLHAAFADERRPLVVGGTGLYLRALFDGLFDEPVMDATLRSRLAGFTESMGVHELRRWVHALDPTRAHLGRTQLLRAIEIALLTGHRVSDLHRERRRTSGWRPRYLLVDPGSALAQRIEARIDEMLDHGWPDEVRRLTQMIPEHAPAWKATGYDAVRRLVRGELTRSEAKEMILIDTRQYAKRQRTWFRHQLPADCVTRVDPLAADWRDVVQRWAA
jgi:tRNA dimethylallyltransferase